jgi:hypothetical protein
MGMNYVETQLDVNDFVRGFKRGLMAPVGSDIVRESKRTYREWRMREHGYSDRDAEFFTVTNPKVAKNERATLVMMLAPERSASLYFGRTINLCSAASEGCVAGCLGVTSGKGVLEGTKKARAVRTVFLLKHSFVAGVLIGAEIRKHIREHGEINVRLNGTSDIRWEMLEGMREIVQSLPEVRFYDYTAWAPSQRGSAPEWHFTYSAKEPSHTNDGYLWSLLIHGENVAIPFAVKKGQPLPDWIVLNGRAFRVIDGDLTDDRTTDPKAAEGEDGVVVGLRWKGRHVDTSGFAREVVAA